MAAAWQRRVVNGSGGNSSEFFYAPDRSRWKQAASYAGTSEQTIYVGGLVEKVTRGGVTSWKHYVAGANGVVAEYIRRSSGTNETVYLLKDHLGSVEMVTDAGGNAMTRLAYGAQGQRMSGTAWGGVPSSGEWTTITNTTRHGFTSHEMLDNLNLTHMNGRVYDQLVGRFLSADPFIDGVGNTQGWNRYSYVRNNPVSFTDPSGFSTDKGLVEKCEYACPGGGSGADGGRRDGGARQYGAAGFLSGSRTFSVRVYQPRAATQNHHSRTGPTIHQPVPFSTLGLAGGARNVGDGYVTGGGYAPGGGGSGGGGSTVSRSSSWFYEPMYEPLTLHSHSVDPASIAGLVYGASNAIGDGLAYNHRMWGQWRGQNGLWYSDRWGGNGATGGRSVAFRQAAAWKFVGTMSAVVTVGISGTVAITAINDGRPRDALKPGFDIGMVGWSALTGPPGWAVGTGYFMVDATIGWGPALEAMNRNMEANRQVLGPSWVG